MADKTKTPTSTDGVVRLVCLSEFDGPEGQIKTGQDFEVTGPTEEAAQARADFLVSTLHVARRLPGEGA